VLSPPETFLIRRKCWNFQAFPLKPTFPHSSRKEKEGQAALADFSVTTKTYGQLLTIARQGVYSCYLLMGYEILLI
jgi:hypothetical protein